MNPFKLLLIPLVALLLGTPQAAAEVRVQCPGDIDGDAVIDVPDPQHPDATCLHLAAGDGYVTMADGRPMYIFSFADITGAPLEMATMVGMLAAESPAPTIAVDEGQEVYLTLTNVGMVMRPDLFDPHTVHWHGFPDAAAVFDGVPDSSIAINMMASLTYYYKAPSPGTYMYHCHVEATEHMQMGMLGNLYVRPAQDKLPAGTDLNGFTHQAGFTYAYNDGDGSTYYDVDAPIQIGSFDPDFHDASENTQPLPFALMKDRYPLLNGRGYPDTKQPGSLPPPAENGGIPSQNVSSLIVADQGDKILLRISNLNVTRFYTLTSNLGVPLKVVGKDAKLLRGPDGQDLSYLTGTIVIGAGEAVDAIVDTQALAPGTYFLYTSNLNYLSNDREDFGGMMTEIVIQ